MSLLHRHIKPRLLLSLLSFSALIVVSCFPRETPGSDDIVYEAYCESAEGDEARIFGVVFIETIDDFDIDDDVIPGANVKIVREIEGSPKGEDVLKTDTDEDGEFSICVPPGRYRLIAWYTEHEKLEYTDCTGTNCSAKSCGGHYLSANVPEENDEFIDLSVSASVEQDVQMQVVYVTG